MDLKARDGVWHHHDLVAAEQAGAALDFLFFWGHTAKSEGDVGPWVFSQWFPRGFDADGTHYASAEHFMMAAKARLFNDKEMLEQILAATSPAEAKTLGRSVKDFSPEIWEANQIDIVTKASIAKFDAHADPRDYLLGTGKRILVEASPNDKIWGIGLRPLFLRQSA